VGTVDYNGTKITVDTTGGGLPYTGLDMGTLLVVGVLLLIIGAAILMRQKGQA
jgi:LPXTG-motif cell wall-anchored protein